MTPKTHSREVIITGILSLGLLFGLISFTNAGEISKSDCVLCGFIKDARTGQPVSDATVYTMNGFVADVRADANGFYCFKKIHQDDICRIAIDSNEYIGIYDTEAMPAVKLSKGKQVVKDFNLDLACMIEVQVVDEANHPVEGAELTATLSGDMGNGTIGTGMLEKRSDKNGLALLGGFPPGQRSYLITAISGKYAHGPEIKWKAVMSQIQWDYAPGKLTVILNDTNVIESGRIVLRKGVDVNGYAEYEDGVPASDLKIAVYPEWWCIGQKPESYSVDSNGSFKLRHIVPGIYRLQANIPRGEGRTEGVTLKQTTLPLPDNEPLVLTIPEKSLESVVSIRGSLIFSGDKIPEYVNISAYSPNKGYYSAIWHNFGGDACDANFVLDRLPPGKYKIAFRGHGLELKVLEDIVAPSEGLEVELYCYEKPHLKGTVIDSKTGKPIHIFKARARHIQTFSQFSNFAQPDKWLDFNNTDGKFEIETVGPDIYQVQIAAENFALACSEDVNTDQGTPVIIKLSAGGGIKGRVVNKDGKPVNGAKVLLLSKAGETTIPSADKPDSTISEDGVVTADGTFEFKYLAEDTKSIKVIHPDYACSIMRDIEIKAGQTTEGIEIMLNKGATVDGYVFDTQGRPRENVTLDFRYFYNSWGDEKANHLTETTTDANGYYRVERLPEEPLTVIRAGEWGSMGVVCRVIVPAKGKVLRLDFGGRSNVTGQIIIDGVALANRKITLSTNDDPASSLFCCYAMTENDGTFTFSGIPGGKWAVYYDDIEKHNNRIKVISFEVAGQNVDLGVIPTALATVRISIEYEQGTPKWAIEKAHLQNENNLWSRPVTEIAVPDTENEPYIAKNVLPGEYCLVLMRKDYSSLRYPIKIEEAESNVTIRLPKCTAGIHGRLTGKYNGSQTVWTKDKTVVSNIRTDENGYYKLDNLPAGRYMLGGNMLIDAGALLEFDLADNEQKVIDMEIPEVSPYSMGSLQVIVLDERGAFLTGVQAWLEGGNGIIEPIESKEVGFCFLAQPQTYTLHTKFTGYKESKQPVRIEQYDLKTMKRPPKPLLVRLAK